MVPATAPMAHQKRNIVITILFWKTVQERRFRVWTSRLNSIRSCLLCLTVPQISAGASFISIIRQCCETFLIGRVMVSDAADLPWPVSNSPADCPPRRPPSKCPSRGNTGLCYQNQGGVRIGHPPELLEKPLKSFIFGFGLPHLEGRSKTLGTAPNITIAHDRRDQLCHSDQESRQTPDV
jgi:hypothetical protein